MLMTRQRILQIAVVVSLFACVIGGGYLFRCWQVKSEFYAAGATLGNYGKSVDFWLRPSFAGEFHWHLQVADGRVVCMHAWKTESSLQRIPPSGSPYLTIEQQDIRAHTCSFTLDPDVYGEFTWISF